MLPIIRPFAYVIAGGAIGSLANVFWLVIGGIIGGVFAFADSEIAKPSGMSPEEAVRGLAEHLKRAEE